MTVRLDGSGLTLDQVVRVARARERVELDPGVAGRMRESRALVDRVLARGEDVYGTTTGVGMRKRFRVDPGAAAEFNRRLILDHRVGQGAPASDEVVRATMLLLAHGFASGRAGVRPELAERLVAALNAGEHPQLRTLGSTGVGDVVPLADLAAALFLDHPLLPKEGIALLNAGAYTTGLAALAVADALRLADALDAAGALDLEAFAANPASLHPRLAEVRPYPGLSVTVARLRSLLGGSFLWETQPRNLQDPLVFRCLPQVHGALRDALVFAERHVATELNGSQDNPLPLPDEDRLVSVGNFDLLPLAQALDLARIALASAVTSACERALKLLQAPLTGLPEGLAARRGSPHSSLSEFAFALQALTGEARLLAQPVSFEVVSTTQAEGIEDRVTLAPLGARRLSELVELAERVVAVGLVLAAQAVDLREPPRLGTGTGRVRALVRELVPFTGPDDAIPQDLEPVAALVRSGALP